MTGQVLVVRHGEGRGRIERYMEPALAALRARSEARGRIRLHNTGERMSGLDGVNAVIFWLADPLREWYPSCYLEAIDIARRARALGIRIVNPPESLSNTVKSRQSRLWLEAGFETPRWVRFEERGALRELAREIGFPVVIRADEAHTQMGLRVLPNARALRSIDPSDEWLPGSVAPVFDLRHSTSGSDRHHPYARFHHKKRIYVLGARVRTEHVFFAKHPLVTARTCTFRRYDRLPMRLQPLGRLSKAYRNTVREDLEYWRKQEEHTALMVKAVETLGLGFAAIDYTTRADASVVLWEANPHPSLPGLHRMRLPRERCAHERLQTYHDAIGDFLLELARSPRTAASAES